MLKNVRLIVCGSRTFTDAALLNETLDRLTAGFDKKTLIIMHGGARGADRLAAEWCRTAWITQEVYHPEWDKHGKAAGPIRNQEMADASPTHCLAFHDGSSPGTADMIEKARWADCKVKVILFEPGK